MEIRIADEKNDFQNIMEHDKWISAEVLEKKIKDQEVVILYDNNQFAGWMRWGLFWDNTPFMNMLHLLNEYRGKGYGRKIVQKWEDEMKSKGFHIVLTSTSATETAQYFYMKLGYKKIGSFTIGDDTMELLFSKNI